MTVLVSLEMFKVQIDDNPERKQHKKKRERENYNIIFTGRLWTEEVKTGLKVPLTS